MDAACEVFYDLVLNYHPEVLSPQFDEFANAANDKKGQIHAPAASVDKYADMNLESFASTLVGIEK